MKRVLLGIGGFVLALLAMLVLPVLSAGHQETTPASEIKSVTGFQCKDEPQCEVDIWKYHWKHHREEDFYYLGIYTRQNRMPRGLKAGRRKRAGRKCRCRKKQ